MKINKQKRPLSLALYYAQDPFDYYTRDEKQIDPIEVIECPTELSPSTEQVVLEN